MSTVQPGSELPTGTLGEPRGPAMLRVMLGAQLRRLREAAGVTPDQAGYEIRASRSKISRMEHGEVGFKERDVADLLTLYGVTDEQVRDGMLLLARQANGHGTGRGMPPQPGDELRGLRPIRTRATRLMDEIYLRLRDYILSGTLAPHERLHQSDLAHVLGVSRTPVREALLRLEREGLIYTRSGHGMFVKGMTAADVSELYDVRLALEPVAARLACAQATADHIVAVERIQRTQERSYPKNLAAAFRINRDLHLKLVQACGNPLMLRFLDNVWDQENALRVFAAYTADRQRVASMISEHRKLIDAFASGDGQRLGTLLEAHIQAACHSLQQRTGQST
jgi:DNA-binding GntR family transcriptional regulator